MLEIEVENLKKKNEELEGKIAAVQKVVAESTCLVNDNEYLFDVMAENKTLEAEKTKAETELCLMKEKVKELEANLKGLSEKVKEEVNLIKIGSKDVFNSQVRRRLTFEEDGCANKKMAPSTPGVVQSSFHGVIDISDDDVNYNEIQILEGVCGLRKGSSKNNLQKTILQHVDDFNFHSSSTRSVKRKRVANIVDSDDESSSYDDNALICTLKAQQSSRVMPNSEEEVNENAGRSHLTRLRNLASKNEQEKTSIDLNKAFSSSEDEEYDDGIEESESEGESLGGFIVDSSDSVSERDSDSSDSVDNSEDVLKPENV
ncbi:hypothetical protein QVD17_08428 [Tagetes erecta]|uniref:Uncharacterized protein n=1 Tax=Tagetes erecta TaxID=13708 RepID=A0AAD8KZ30_TARER|nr:hypothetical protein QVD17_08428 [Tagetes erecta]